MRRRWVFGDQLGPHFTDDLDESDSELLLVESRRVFARRRFHRAKAHLVLSAMRHRAAGDPRVRYVAADTYGEVLDDVEGPLDVVHPTSRAALGFVRSRGLEVLPARGFATSMEHFGTWVDGRKRLLMEDFYRDARRRHDVLMDGAEPTGGRWNFDADNREAPPRTPRLDVAEPWWPVEDEIDEQVRADLDRWAADGDVSFSGDDGPRRFAATREEALAVLEHFVTHRLPLFGRFEDAMLREDDWMAHSLLSAPMNLGLLDPLEVVARVERAYRAGDVSIAAAEGYVRQVIGWRDYVWHIYWASPPDYARRNRLGARRAVPAWFRDLDADAVEAACLSDVLRDLRAHGWVHHIPRLMVLGNYAMQRGWSPQEMAEWFTVNFVDGYPWVMTANVVGMSQYADGGVMSTKPYAGGGAYVDRMSDYCGGCRYNPKKRVGDDACPFTAGYWWFLSRNREQLEGNHRLAQPLRGLDRLKDLEALVTQEETRASTPP